MHERVVRRAGSAAAARVQAPEPSIATPADPTAKPVELRRPRPRAAPALNIPKPPARANAEFTRALDADARQRSHAGHPRDSRC